MSIDASSSFARLSRTSRALQTSGAQSAIEHCSIYLIVCQAVFDAAYAAAESTKPAHPVINMAAFPKRLAGKKVAIFIDYQFEDLEVTFPMLRSVHKSSASPPPLQLTG